MKTLPRFFAPVIASVLFVVGMHTLFAASAVPSDVTGNRYQTAIRYLFTNNIVVGYPDGTYKPNKVLNRAELVALSFAGKNITLDATRYKNCFPDVTTQWFAPYVCYAKAQGWVSGYPSGLFLPAQEVKKVEGVAVLMKAYGVKTNYATVLPYTDLTANAWYTGALKAAYAQNLLEETRGRYNPAGSLTRGAVSEIVYRFLTNKQTPVTPTTSVPVTPSATVSQRTRLTQNDLQYVGAFRLPNTADGGSSRFGYGGDVMTFNPYGDPTGGTDGYPGSLLILGHDTDQLVAEVSIPAPRDHRTGTLGQLPTARFLQPFTDITGGKAATLDEGNGFRVAGMAVLEPQGSQTTPKLYWTARTYYNVDTSSDVSHGVSDLDFSALNARGLWRLGDYHSNMTAGYIFTVPSYFADAYLQGKRLISGLFVQQGVSATSQGPAFFAYAPWKDAASGVPEDGAKLNATALVYYPYSSNFQANGIDPVSNFPNHQIPDNWLGATWVDTPSKHAIVVTGVRAMGETYYGDARPSDCTIYKGYHGEPFEPRILFYDPADLARVAQKQKSPTEVIPYLEWNPADYFVPTCAWGLTGASYDSANHLLYIVQRQIVIDDEEPSPLVHVFKVKL